jgi:hypothetical protein
MNNDKLSDGRHPSDQRAIDEWPDRQAQTEVERLTEQLATVRELHGMALREKAELECQLAAARRHLAEAGKVDAELEAAIRVFTVDVAWGALPNGETERAIERLGDALNDHNIGHAKQAFGDMCAHFSADTRRLRIAAEDYFGGDFRKEVTR